MYKKKGTHAYINFIAHSKIMEFVDAAASFIWFGFVCFGRRAWALSHQCVYIMSAWLQSSINNVDKYI